MPRLVEMGTLVTRCQQRCDLEGESHVSAAEWLALISESYGELFSIVAGSGLRYFERSATLTSDGNAYVDEPSAIQSLLGLWYAPSSGRRHKLRPIQPQELGQYAGNTGTARRYELIDDRIYLYPTPPTGQDYEIRYIPQAPDLSEYASDECVDVVTAEGMAFLIWCTAVKALSKSETDVRLAMAERDRMAEKVLDWAINRMMLEPQRTIADHDDDCDEDEGAWGYG
jgi:hypothetical protein